MKVNIELAPVTITLETREEVTNLYALLKDADDRKGLVSYCPLSFIIMLRRALDARLYL